jgi:beta-lactamase class A
MKRFFITILMLLPLTAFAEDIPMAHFVSRIEALEQKEGGRIGIAAVNTANGEHLEYRGDERFAMCSTFKLLLAAAVLSRVDIGKERLDHMVEFNQADILEYAPITKEHLKEGKMSITDLSGAAIQYSDNTAANLLLQSIGGPEAFTRYVRSLGDKVTRLDRIEPTLNANLTGDTRDTTTPSAMVDIMQKVLIGNALSSESREQLNAWLIGNTTGDKKLRAGINPAWKIGDKTGSGKNGASNDVAIIWPAGKEPFLVTVYYTGAEISPDQQSEVIAEVGRLVSATFYPEQ